MCDSEFSGIWGLSQCWGNVSRWVISRSDWISESLDRAIFWILIYLLSVRMPSVRMSGITHGSLWRLMTRDASLELVTLSRLSHVTLSGSGRGVAALYWRRHPASPGLRWPQSPALRLGAGQMYTRSLPANRQSLHWLLQRGGSPAWSCDQAEWERERPVLGLSEESLSGLGAEKPGPYKEMLIRNEENNDSIIRAD